MATTQIKNGFNGGTDDQLLVNPDGSINVNTSGGGGSNASVGLTGAAAPTSATEIGGVDGAGILQHAKVDANGAILVNTSGSFAVQDLKVLFNEVSTISVGIETSINTYTAPAGKISYLLTVYCSGENRAQFNIYSNAVLFDRQYTNVTQMSALFDYKTGSNSVPGYVIPPGDIITVKTINSGTTTASYNCRLLILEVT